MGVLSQKPVIIMHMHCADVGEMHDVKCDVMTNTIKALTIGNTKVDLLEVGPSLLIVCRLVAKKSLIS